MRPHISAAFFHRFLRRPLFIAPTARRTANVKAESTNTCLHVSRLHNAALALGRADALLLEGEKGEGGWGGGEDDRGGNDATRPSSHSCALM